jgi:hypothetical protein
MPGMNRQELIEEYIDRILEGMSTKDLMRIVGDQLEENFSTYTDEELISEVEEYYPELLGEDESQETKNELSQEEVDWLRENVKPQNS